MKVNMWVAIILVGFAGLCPETGSAADSGDRSLESALAAVNLSIKGRWRGSSEFVNLETGAVTETTLNMTYGRWNEHELDYAYTTDRGMTYASWLEGGLYRLRTWPFEGEAFTIDYLVTDVSPPDGMGHWRVDEVVFWPLDNGRIMPLPQVYRYENGILSVEREVPASGIFPSALWMRGYRLQRQ